MSGVVSPDHVVRFITAVGEFLGHFHCSLEPSENPNLVGKEAQEYRISGVGHPTFLVVHRTEASVGQPFGEYRARARAILPAELQGFLQGKAAALNQLATLGALLEGPDRAEVACQFLLDEADCEMTAGVMAAALVHAAPSLLVSIRKAMLGEAQGPVQAMSAWSDLDFEQIHYDCAHLGTGRLRTRGWSLLLTPEARLDLNAVQDNPYWGGGLLALLRLPAETFQLGGREADLNELNLLCHAMDNVPTVGAWCRDGEEVVFVTFAPNLLKQLPGFTDRLVGHLPLSMP
jgi:hypothetical protein